MTASASGPARDRALDHATALVHYAKQLVLDDDIEEAAHVLGVAARLLAQAAPPRGRS